MSERPMRPPAHDDADACRPDAAELREIAAEASAAERTAPAGGDTGFAMIVDALAARGIDPGHARYRECVAAAAHNLLDAVSEETR